jgi:hypothetical protein
MNWKQRLGNSAAVGILVALALGWYSLHHRHARLVAAAARMHETTGTYLAGALAGMAVIVAVAVFILATILGRRRRPAQQQARGRRRGGRYQGDPEWGQW